jgi:hypothetical protein
MLGYKARYWECDKIFVPRRCRTIIRYFTFRVDRTIKLLHLGPEVEFIKCQFVEKLKISAIFYSETRLSLSCYRVYVQGLDPGILPQQSLQ